jgi:hypothetical protein
LKHECTASTSKSRSVSESESEWPRHWHAAAPGRGGDRHGDRTGPGGTANPSHHDGHVTVTVVQLRLSHRHVNRCLPRPAAVTHGGPPAGGRTQADRDCQRPVPTRSLSTRTMTAWHRARPGVRQTEALVSGSGRAAPRRGPRSRWPAARGLGPGRRAFMIRRVPSRLRVLSCRPGRVPRRTRTRRTRLRVRNHDSLVTVA